MALSASHEDYLRTIWKLDEWQDHPVTSGELARALGLSPSTVTEGVQRLVTMGLVRHARYGKISLTDQGRVEAARMVRIHRLIETALVTCLGYSWDEVHDEAEKLEHAVSDAFIARLDATLGHPTHDPHGDRIPQPDDMTSSTSPLVTLADLGAGCTATIERVADDDPQILKALFELGLLPGVRVSVVSTQRGLGLMTIEVQTESPKPRADIAMNVATAIAVINVADPQ
ncbi:MAG: metal-dependent transcriptional regulator [Actinomycetaceae bacterium]|nr:metal-dependent transcriptional regulator [Actinomycetaceae bacterium]